MSCLGVTRKAAALRSPVLHYIFPVNQADERASGHPTADNIRAIVEVQRQGQAGKRRSANESAR